MAGTQTHGFDMAIEISSGTIQRLLSGTFDSEGLLGNIFPDTVILDGFSLEVDFNRPSGIPAGSLNPIRLLLDLRFAGGISGTLDVVAGLDVDRTASDKDKVILDFKNRLYKCDVAISGFPIPGVDGFVENKLKALQIPLIPIPVDRSTTSTFTISRAEVKVIDGNADEDALLVTLTYGGGAAGNLNGFTQAFSRQGAGAAVAINFAWICRMVSPKIENAIGLSPGSFTNCGFNGDHEIKDGVKLRSLSLSAAEDHLRVTGRVSKSGTCYDASGTFDGKIFVAIEAGRLKVSFSVEDPDIDVDIPWYCWIAGAVVGALLGGIIFGVIGVIVGGVLISLITYIAQTVVESTVENVAGQVTGAINDIDDVDIQLVGIDTVLDRAFIDDMTITYDMNLLEYWPIKAEGYLTVYPNQYFDLDSGMVKNESFGTADLKLEGTDQSRRIKIMCGSSVAALASRSFSSIRRYELLMLNYGFVSTLTLDNFAYFYPIPFLPDIYVETLRVYAIKTSDGSYGIFQVTNVDESKFIIRYKVYKSAIYTLDITGNFSCFPTRYFPADLANFELESVQYFTGKETNQKFSAELSAAAPLKSLIRKASMEDQSRPANFLNNIQQGQKLDAVDLKVISYNKGVGEWLGTYKSPGSSKTARFVAKVTGNIVVTNYVWVVDNQLLDQDNSGTITIRGAEFEFKTSGRILTLSSKSASTFEIPVKVTISFGNGLNDSVIRCVTYRNDCKIITRYVPDFKQFLGKFEIEYGVVPLRKEQNFSVGEPVVL